MKGEVKVRGMKEGKKERQKTRIMIGWVSMETRESDDDPRVLRLRMCSLLVLNQPGNNPFLS